MYFIAKKIYQVGEAGRVSASAVRIATFGVAVGILVMIVSLCVTIGFQQEIKGRVASLVGHIHPMVKGMPEIFLHSIRQLTFYH